MQGQGRKYLQLGLFILVLYVFLVSIKLLGCSLKLFGEDLAENLIRLTTNPLVGLFIGILATSIIQSSSTTTSIVVGMVAGGTLSLRGAIPIIMGANIGTTVTNILVSLCHVTRKEEFRRAFAGSTVHDVFNVLAVAIFLPLEITFHYLERVSLWLANIFVGIGGVKVGSVLKYIVGPVVNFITKFINHPIGLIILSLVLLFFALYFLVRIMKGLMATRIELMIDKYLFRRTINAFALGLIFTAVIQSSSVASSIVIPLVGAGILSVNRLFPYILGTNIGTTVTAILASLVTQNPTAMALAFSHLIFNSSAAFIIYNFLREIPLKLARKLGDLAAEKRVIAFLYIIITFYIIPFVLIFLTK